MREIKPEPRNDGVISSNQRSHVSMCICMLVCLYVCMCSVYIRHTLTQIVHYTHFTLIHACIIWCTCTIPYTCKLSIMKQSGYSASERVIIIQLVIRTRSSYRTAVHEISGIIPADSGAGLLSIPGITDSD